MALFKLRIGLVITVTALAGLAVSGNTASTMQLTVLMLSVLVSSAAAGAFNQYYEHDIDPLMSRTRSRPFATGALRHGPRWLALILTLVAVSVAAAWVGLNPLAAFFVCLGAFFYAIVYTVGLKRRTCLNIVIGGLAGSWAVLAGATAVAPEIGALPLALAFVLFLWTPPHFWSLAIAFADDYARAGVPMLPVVVGQQRAAKAVFFSAVVLVASSFVPLGLGMGAVYFLFAASGGALFVLRARQLAQSVTRASAMRCFHASLMQLSLVLVGAVVDSRII